MRSWRMHQGVETVGLSLSGGPITGTGPPLSPSNQSENSWNQVKCKLSSTAASNMPQIEEFASSSKVPLLHLQGVGCAYKSVFMCGIVCVCVCI